MENLVTQRSYDEAKKLGISYSAFLEREDSSSEYKDGTDAFERQLILADIRVRDNPITGERAHNLERFYEADGEYGDNRKFLLPEFFNRTYRKAAHDASFGNTRLWDNLAPVSYTVAPPTIDTEIRWKQIQPSILPLLVSRTRTITTETFRSIFLNDSLAESAARLRRVSEGAAIPFVSFTHSENANTVRKYGRALRWTYEQARRLSIDFVGWAVGYIAAVSTRDKEDDAIDILLNGDGNSGTSATANSGSTYDGAASGALTLKMLMNFRLSAYKRPYYANLVIGRPADLTNLFLLNAGSANLPASMIVGNNTSNVNPAFFSMARTTLDGMTAIDSTVVAANSLLFVDSRFSLEMIREANSDVVESDRIVNSQWQELYMTENIGWAISLKNMAQLLNYTV